jgi:hypothetical protein
LGRLKRRTVGGRFADGDGRFEPQCAFILRFLSTD